MEVSFSLGGIWQVIFPLTAGALLLLVFTLHESRTESPMIPLRLLNIRTSSVAFWGRLRPWHSRMVDHVSSSNLFRGCRTVHATTGCNCQLSVSIHGHADVNHQRSSDRALKAIPMNGLNRLADEYDWSWNFCSLIVLDTAEDI